MGAGRGAKVGELIATSQGWGIYREGKGKGKGINRAGEEALRAGYGNKINF